MLPVLDCNGILSGGRRHCPNLGQVGSGLSLQIAQFVFRWWFRYGDFADLMNVAITVAVMTMIAKNDCEDLQYVFF